MTNTVYLALRKLAAASDAVTPGEVARARAAREARMRQRNREDNAKVVAAGNPYVGQQQAPAATPGEVARARAARDKIVGPKSTPGAKARANQQQAQQESQDRRDYVKASGGDKASILSALADRIYNGK